MISGQIALHSVQLPLFTGFLHLRLTARAQKLFRKTPVKVWRNIKKTLWYCIVRWRDLDNNMRGGPIFSAAARACPRPRESLRILAIRGGGKF